MRFIHDAGYGLVVLGMVRGGCAVFRNTSNPFFNNSVATATTRRKNMMMMMVVMTNYS